MCLRYASWFALLLALPAVAANQIPMTSITLQVVSPDGKPLESAHVLVRLLKTTAKLPNKTKTAWAGITNAQGVSTSDPLPRGNFQVKVAAAGYRLFSGLYDVADAAKTIPVSMVLGVAISEVTVRVTNTEGDPLVDAPVDLKFVKGSAPTDKSQPHLAWELHTNDEGIAKVRNMPEQIVTLPEGSAAVHVSYRGYRTYEQTFTVDQPEQTLDVRMEPDTNWAKLTVVVTTMGGRPLEHAEVIVRFVKGRSLMKLGKKVLTTWEVRTNQDGIAKLQDVPEGTIRVQVVAKGYQTFGQEYELTEEAKTIEVKLQSPQEQYSAH